MATRAVQQVITYLAWDTSANTYKTGDSANHTLRWVKDGTASATTNATAEVDATNLPGVYKVTMTSTETDCLEGMLGGKSSTANVVIIPTMVSFDYIPNAATGTSGGLPVIGTGTNNFKSDASANVTFANTSIGSVTGSVNSVTTGVTVTTNNDKTGYSLTQSFPTNFSSLAITVGGAVTVGTNNDKTGYTASTVSDKTGYSIASGGIGSGAHAAAELNNIADGVLDRVLSAGTDSGGNNTTARTVRQALRVLRNKASVTAGTLTVTKEDDTTTSWTAAIGTTAGNPISSVDPT